MALGCFPGNFSRGKEEKDLLWKTFHHVLFFFSNLLVTSFPSLPKVSYLKFRWMGFPTLDVIVIFGITTGIYLKLYYFCLNGLIRHLSPYSSS